MIALAGRSATRMDPTRVIQHEYDHLQGLTIFDRMGGAQRHIKKQRYLKWYKKFKKRSKKE